MVPNWKISEGVFWVLWMVMIVKNKEVINHTINTPERRMINIDCLPVFSTILLETVTPKITPIHAQIDNQNAYGILASPAIV